MKVRTIAALFCCAASVGVVACGDDETSDSSSGGSGSEEAFVEDVNAACEAQNDALAEVVRTTPPRRGSEEDFAAAAIPTGEDLVAALNAIEPPSDLADEYQEFIDNQQAQIDELRADPVAALQGSTLAPKADALARELGVDSCLTATGASAG